MKTINGIVIAGTHSGCGKTTVTLGLLAALKKKGLSVQSFKTGPDFIDAGLHKLLTGRPSRNLDLWMCGEDYVRACFKKYSADADVSVVEGVMGLYDGKLSTAHLASALNLPVVIVVDAYGMAESAGAVVKGFVEYRDSCPSTVSVFEKNSSYQITNNGHGSRITGVVFNRVASENHFKRLKDSVQDVPVLGYLPRDLDFEIPHRHLGLTVAEENPLSEQTINKLANVVLKYVDVDLIVQKCKSSKEQKNKSPEEGKSPYHTSALLHFRTSALKIAVAYDKAFCFYYEDNLDLLREAGADIVFFSPLSDEKIPDGVDALYIGGGYPEIYAKQLSENKAMSESVRKWSESDKPVYAECGGFMYLTEGIYDFNNIFHPMVGVFPVETKMAKKRVRLGYREIALREDCVLGRKGSVIRGHEFHYSEIADRIQNIEYRTQTENSLINPPQSPFVKGGLNVFPPLTKGGKGGFLTIYSVKDGTGNALHDEGYRVKNTLGSYIHIHFGSNMEIAKNFIGFIKKCIPGDVIPPEASGAGILPGKDSGQAGMTERILPAL